MSIVFARHQYLFTTNTSTQWLAASHDGMTAWLQSIMETKLVLQYHDDALWAVSGRFFRLSSLLTYETDDDDSSYTPNSVLMASMASLTTMTTSSGDTNDIYDNRDISSAASSSDSIDTQSTSIDTMTTPSSTDMTQIITNAPSTTWSWWATTKMASSTDRIQQEMWS